MFSFNLLSKKKKVHIIRKINTWYTWFIFDFNMLFNDYPTTELINGLNNVNVFVGL